MTETRTTNPLLNNLNRLREYGGRFRSTFGLPIKPFWSNLTGFDVIAFDDFIQPGEEESTADAVERKYGTEAVRLIRLLIGSAEGASAE